MKVGLHMQMGPRHWAPVTAVAEEAGFESVWLPEHLIMPVEMTGRPGSPHEGTTPISGATPAWDVFMQIAYLAGRTSTIRFGTNVFNIGLRHPFVTARSVTTADLLSDGRFEFGIGASWLAEEWQAMELPFGSRPRRVAEAIGICQRLFTEDEVEHEGEFFRFQPVTFLPKPVQRPWPPMLIGGDSPAALRRAAELGDGWLPMAHTLETLPDSLRLLQQLRDEAGRGEQPFAVTLFRFGEPTVDNLRRCEDLGVHRVLVSPFDRSAEAIDGIKRFADEVLPALTD